MRPSRRAFISTRRSADAEPARASITRLYGELLKRLETQDVHLAVAGVALPNDASIALHRKLGFEEIGIFKEYATKHGQLISSVWFQRRVRPAPRARRAGASRAKKNPPESCFPAG